MKNLKSLLDPNRFTRPELKKKGRPINLSYEQAREFGEYVGIETILVMRLFKIYGIYNVLSLRSFLADCPVNKEKGGKFVLAQWKLKELKKNKKIGV